MLYIYPCISLTLIAHFVSRVMSFCTSAVRLVYGGKQGGTARSLKLCYVDLGILDGEGRDLTP